MREQIKNFVNDMLKPLRNRVYLMITRALIESVNDSGGMQTVKVNLLADETKDEVERFQNYGFTSNPPDNSECIALSVGGNRDHMIIIVADDRASRLKDLLKGESAQYNGVTGDFLKLDQDGNLVGQVTAALDLAVAQVRMTNGTDDYTDLLIQALTALSVEPFIVNKGTFATLATKLTAFKVV